MADGAIGSCRVLGVGNPERGDDAAGRAVARALRGALPAHVALAEADGEATGILAIIDGASTAIIIDTCASGAAAGSIHRFDVSRNPLPADAFAGSTHGFGLHQAIELARVLGQLPPRCVIYAIEGADFETGALLSPPVLAAVAEVASRVRAELLGEQDNEEQADA